MTIGKNKDVTVVDKNTFPPVRIGAEDSQIKMLIALLGSAIPEKSAIYVGGPITSGSRFDRWFNETGHALNGNADDYWKARYEAVVRPNIETGLRLAGELRRRRGEIVIEPFSLYVSTWTQDDYRYFWGKVVEQYVKEVVFVDGWAGSNGAAYECYTALQFKKTVRDGNGPITVADAEEAILKYIRGAEDRADQCKFLRRIAEELNGLKASQGKAS